MRQHQDKNDEKTAIVLQQRENSMMNILCPTLGLNLPSSTQNTTCYQTLWLRQTVMYVTIPSIIVASCQKLSGWTGKLLEALWLVEEVNWLILEYPWLVEEVTFV